MPRKKKKQEEDLVKKSAPDVEVNLIDGPKQEVEPVVEPVQEPVDDLIENVDSIDKNTVIDTKKMLFELSPNNKKTLTINKIVPKRQSLKEIAEIKARLKVKPLISSYRGSRSRKSACIGLNFKVGREHIH